MGQCEHVYTSPFSALFCQQECFHSYLSSWTCQKHNVFPVCHQNTLSSLSHRDTGDTWGREYSSVRIITQYTVAKDNSNILILPCTPLCETPSARWQGGWYNHHWATVSAPSRWERCSLPPHLGRYTWPSGWEIVSPWCHWDSASHSGH